MGNLVGAKVESQDLIKNNKFIYESKETAKKYKWLYQCTNIEALKNILKSKEIWLSNLKTVNDAEEVKRINVPEFEKSFFVACFTYEDNIPKEHWGEYGDGENGVLYGFKQDWVLREAELMWRPGEKVEDIDFKIYSKFDEALEAACPMLKKHKRVCNPYFFWDFGFYQIVYDDELKKEMSGECALDIGDGILKGVRFITPSVVGIIKNTHGLCKGKNAEVYDKDWTTEKEVRLKVGIGTTHDILPKELFFPKMAIKLKENAFDELVIRFSPTMTEEKRKENIKEIEKLLPNGVINVLQ
ncbi:MAG: hypothetical protein GX284_13575 [Clostridiales bacterium]|nr:hypothetical protein [Clostridiales bacterium]